MVLLTTCKSSIPNPDFSTYRTALLRVTACVVVAGRWILPANAESLHEKVDAAMDQVRPGPAPVPADDLGFLRRASLALAGTPPPVSQVRAFLTDHAPDKRERLVRTLAGSSGFVRHLAVQLDVMLMERRGEMHTKASEWRQWLEVSLTSGKPWDEMVREILAADGSDEKTRPVARWLLERQAEPNLLARDAGRLFLGVDLACAQCHDHPRIDDYAQRDYHGLAAFFTRTYLFQPDPAKPGLVGEQAKGEAAYTSVFTKVSGDSPPGVSRNHGIVEPVIAENALWKVAPNEKDKNVRPLPNYSRRARLADALISEPAFRRNLANRLWGMVMGRCLVEPPDLTHSGNPPVHPAVLDVLAEELAALKFDLRHFIRELALTKTFAEAFEPMVPAAPDLAVLEACLPQLESAADAANKDMTRLRLAFTERVEAFEAAFHAGKPALAEWNKLETAHRDAIAVWEKAAADLKIAQEKAVALTETVKLLSAATTAGEAVSKAAPGDKELEAAAKTFRTKLDKSTAEAHATEKDIPVRKAAAGKAAAAVEPARIAAEAKQPAADEARAKIAATGVVREQADTEKRDARVKAHQAGQKVKEVKALLAYGRTRLEATPLLDAARQKEREALEAGKSLAAKRAILTGSADKISLLEKANADSQASVAAADKKLAGAVARVSSLGDASGKGEAVLGKFPDDAEIQAAAKTLMVRKDQAEKDREAAQHVLDETRAAAQKATAGLMLEQANHTGAQEEVLREECRFAAGKAVAEEAEKKAAPLRAALMEASQALAAVGSNTFSVANLAPVPPEQLCWSILEVTGTMDQLKQLSQKEWDEKNKPTGADKADPAKQVARLAGIEALCREKVKPHEDQFVRLFANGAGQPQSDFFATADQVLYFENAGSVRSWTNPGGDNLASRLLKQSDSKTLAEELYLAVLTRVPSPAEVEEISELLASRPADQRGAAVSDAIWALLTTTEFRFLH